MMNLKIFYADLTVDFKSETEIVVTNKILLVKCCHE